MASASLDLVRSIYAAWERGDYSLTDWAHPEIEFVIADGPAPGSWTGLSGMAKAWGDFLSAWEEPRAHAEDYRELDDERVLVLFYPTGRGKTSGLELAQMGSNAATLFHVRGSKVKRLVIYLDGDSALADLGPRSGAVLVVRFR